MVRILINRPQSIYTMAVVTDTGQRISLGSTPGQFDYSKSATVGKVDRTGKKTISRTVSPGTASVSFTHMVASLDWQEPITSQLNALIDLGSEGRTVRFIGGSSLEQANWWTITGIQVTVQQRTPQNEPSRAVLRWSLIEAVDVGGRAANSTGVSNPIPPAPVAAPEPAPAPAPVIVQQQAAVRTYTVVPGDTLWAIAQRFLGNGARWPEIWNMNQDQIANPNLIYPGQVLRIPGG